MTAELFAGIEHPPPPELPLRRRRVVTLGVAIGKTATTAVICGATKPSCFASPSLAPPSWISTRQVSVHPLAPLFFRKTFSPSKRGTIAYPVGLPWASNVRASMKSCARYPDGTPRPVFQAAS